MKGLTRNAKIENAKDKAAMVVVFLIALVVVINVF